MNETELKEKLTESLESNGFLRSVAGDDDFNSVLRATAEVIGRQKIGIYFAGAVGAGKTAAAQAASATIAKFAKRKPPVSFSAFFLADMQRLAADAETGRIGDFIVDDIATDVAMREYGNTVDPFAKFVMAWDAEIATGRPTRLLYVTTNEKASAVEARYGARVFDRLVWRLATCQLVGTTKRGTVGSPWRDNPPKTDEELERAAVDALYHERDSFVRDEEGEREVQERVSQWKQEAESMKLVRDLASQLVKRMCVSKTA